MTITRRTVLKRAGLAGTAALGAGSVVRPASAAHSPAGIQLFTVRDALEADPAGTLRRLRSIGFEEVETAGLAGLSAREFRNRLDDAGLAAPSAHLALAEDALDAAFDDAHVLGARFAVTGILRPGTGSAAYEVEPAGTPPMRAMTLEDARRTAEIANRVGERARRAGLTYAYHNHHFEFEADQGVVPFDELLRLTDPSLVAFELDCGWASVAGRDPSEYLRRYPGRFPLIHVKDFLPPRASDMKTSARLGAELGRGTIDYGPIFAAASAGGLEHYFVEQEGPFSRMGPLEAAAVARDYLGRVKP